MSENAYDKAIETFRNHSGLMRTQQAIDEGIAPRTLYQMRETGVILRESRGLYRLADTEPGAYFDLVQVALKIPKAVICLMTSSGAKDLVCTTVAVPAGIDTAILPTLGRRRTAASILAAQAAQSIPSTLNRRVDSSVRD